MTTGSTSAVESGPTRDRWRLHRGGIVNIWQYAEQTFDFSGGRAIFQGTNGSGKSRTLELLLPLCLDGDLRQLGSKGFDTVSIRRLMLDDYDGGPNRIGYAWVELRRVADSGETEYLTCGLGVKASKTSQQITDSWRFVTPARVGVDVALIGADRVPLGPAHLREAIGADCMFEDAAFRATIAETVYGVPAARYGDLLHLQRTLRNPDVGLKVLEGQLEQILSDALPPLDAVMVEQLATSFDDLESIRENITRLSSADTALRTFLRTYSDYAFGGLRAAEERLRSAEDAVRKFRRDSGKLAAQLEQSRTGRTEAEQTQAELEIGEQRAEELIAALKDAPAYRDLQDLQGHEKLVAAKRAAAEAALEVASKQRAQEDGAVDGVLRLLRRLADDLSATEELAEPLRGQLRAAGLDETRCPAVPTAPAGTADVVSERVRAKPDPEAEPLPIERRVPPSVHTDDLAATLRAARDATTELASTARQRGALTLALHQQASDLDHQHQHVDNLGRSVREARLAATDAAGVRDQADQEFAGTARSWLGQVDAWREAGPLAATQPHDSLVLPTATDLGADPATARALTNSARQWSAPLVQAARDAAHRSTTRRADLRDRINAHDKELAALRSGQERTPERARHAEATRNAATGSPFYRLVDFADGLAEADRAGLEAALQASGLLDAWVTATGDVTAADLPDVFATPRPPVAGRSLAAALVPAPEPGSPVSTDTVAALLAGIALTDDSTKLDSSPDSTVDSALSLSPNGRWRAGPLTGSWSKPAAEFIGAGAREAARSRRIAALEEELSDLRGDLSRAEEELSVSRDRVAEWERHLESFPGDGELIAKHSRAQAAKESADRAEQRARELLAEQETAQQRWEAARADLVRQAGEAGLPVETEPLRQAQQSSAEAQRSADRLGDALSRQCLGTVDDLVDTMHRYHAAVADRQAAEREADDRCVEYGTQASTLAELSEAVGGEAKEIAAQLHQQEDTRRRMRADLKGLREKVAELREQAAKLDALLGTTQEQLATATTDADRAAEVFRATAAAPGVLAAALPDTELPTDDVDGVRAAIAEAGDRRGAGEGTVITKLQALQTSLAGSHDIAAEQHLGLLTVTVTGEEGARPVAVAAQQVAAKLGEQRGFLDEQYQRIFADYLIRDLAEWLRGQIAVAEDLCTRMNEVLNSAQSSQGVHVELEWKPSAALDEETRQALALVRMPYASRTPEQDATLRRVFTERIEAERDTHSSGYAEILSRALDYRTWHSFTVRVGDTGPDGNPRVRRLRQLSSGETRLVSYVTLFAAAASFYDAVSSASESFNPLRLVLLDEAFERLDDPTIARMLGLLVDLDMDWVITWPSGWGVSDKIPRMHIFDVLRPKNGRGVACTQTTWDGAALDRVDP
ncbi:TIGR02680 family protein [Solihabitans fulvus]|uniref:TIGR02680 family protein n=1 Tax=Solihabitans fulvus TaxID=1892852 RepID=A0A5B2XL31_9PSEU|nr:TIGR02680 family protein [Solihabitans fulvus]KAA2263825.1 TIGR02680 family protein [Solihabitans fulvus]